MREKFKIICNLVLVIIAIERTLAELKKDRRKSRLARRAPLERAPLERAPLERAPLD